jgi:pimeloyl-[acyl-carrier protein] methyl ester esterase
MPFLESEPGVLLHWEELGAGRPVVFVHGWSMSSRAFAWQAQAAAASHRVIRYDLRGHGRSRCEGVASAGAGHAIGDHARDLAALLVQLELRSATLVAWSMGSQIALEALPGIQERLVGLVLLSATPRFTADEDWPHGLPAASVRALAARLEHRPDRTLQRFFDGMFVAGEVGDPERAEIVRRVLVDAPPVSPLAARAGLEALLTSDQRGRLAEVRVPTLLLHGERDPICLPAASAFAQARIPGARRHVLPAGGHAPHLSRPSLVDELLAGFLSDLP